jgi:hypothetical protein
MKKLQPDELYQNLQEFLQNKGVELKAGSYARKIQKSCSLLSDAINTSQQGLSRAKEEIDKKLGQLRQVIHEKTAPSPPRPAASAAPPPAAPVSGSATPGQASVKPGSRGKPAARKTGARKGRARRRPAA